MSRSDQDRFADIKAAIARCQTYAKHLKDDDALVGMAYDAILRNLAVIGEAARALSTETRDTFPDIPWASITGLRNVVIHEYFRVDKTLILDIVDHGLASLSARLDAQR